MSDKIRSFLDLKVWQEAHKLVLMVYKTTRDFPKHELYSLVDQMRRSSTSTTANIAEGFGRQSYKDKVHFFYISQGSLTELKNFLVVARDVGYISSKDFNDLFEQANFSHRLLQGLITKSKSFISF